VATFTRSVNTSTKAFDFTGVNAALDEIAAEGDAFLARLGASAPASRRELFCEARYRNQLWDIDVPLGDQRRFEGADAVAGLQRRFDELHEAIFAVRSPGEPVEVQAWRGDVRVHRQRPALPARTGDQVGSGRPAARPVFFTRVPVETTVRRAADLRIGETVDGPAIIEEPTTTIVIPPGAQARVRPSHYLVDVGGEHAG
jgi:N-methylhydantoinase A